MAATIICVPSYGGELEDGTVAIKAGQYVNALKILLPLANGGNAQAQRMVGEMAYKGQGMRVDMFAAFKWTELAASGGDMVGQYNLGYLYEHGAGVAVSRSSAIDSYRDAAVKGYAPAQMKLGELYASSDRAMSMSWYRAAMDAGDVEGRKRFSAMGQENARARENADRRAAEIETTKIVADREDACRNECSTDALYQQCYKARHGNTEFNDAKAECSARTRIVQEDSAPSSSVLAGIQEGLARSQQSAAQLGGVHNALVARLNAQQQERARLEADQRERMQAQQRRADAERRAQIAQQQDARAEADSREKERQRIARRNEAELQEQQEHAALRAEEQRIETSRREAVALPSNKGEPRASYESERIRTPVVTGRPRGDVTNSSSNARPPLATPTLDNTATKGSEPPQCISYGAIIPESKSVCFEQSLRQYRCVRTLEGEYRFGLVQTLTMKSDLKSVFCTHVDRENRQPVANMIWN